MFVLDHTKAPVLGLAGLESPLSEEEQAIQQSAHRFAEEVMRPIGAQLDKMTPEDVIAEGSPYYTYLQQMAQSGILDLEAIGGMSGQEKARILPLIFEELGWGDSGLAIGSLAASFPAFVATMSGDAELIERFGSKLGCWIASQPDRGGSDVIDSDMQESYPGKKQHKGNVLARIDGDDVIVTGQSSAWVSSAPAAQSALAYMACDYGDGYYDKDGKVNYIALLIPFDEGNVSKGKPLDKIGQRSLPQGEVFFDEVRVPKKYIVAGRDQSYDSFYGALTFANMEMGFTFTGAARAAYEHALAYVHERKQGGVPLIEHQTVRLRLFNMWQKVEASRAMAHRAAQFNYLGTPHLLASVTSKTFVTQSAFEVANEAIQLFGGNGLTAEYPVEKLFRDIRASLIEDGENNLLSLKGASWLSEAYKLTV